MLRPIEKSTIKTRTLSSAQRLKTHVRVSLSRVHVNQQWKKPEAEAHVRVHTLLHVVACCCVLLGIVAQGFNPVKLLSQKNPQISFVPCLSWSPKLSAAMLPFALLFQHYWGHACALHLVSKVLWVVSFPRCTACPSIVRSCCICLHITANMDAITPNIVGPPMLGVVWSICKYIYEEQVAVYSKLRHWLQKCTSYKYNSVIIW